MQCIKPPVSVAIDVNLGLQLIDLLIEQTGDEIGFDSINETTYKIIFS